MTIIDIAKHDNYLLDLSNVLLQLCLPSEQITIDNIIGRQRYSKQNKLQLPPSFIHVLPITILLIKIRVIGPYD